MPNDKEAGGTSDLRHHAHWKAFAAYHRAHPETYAFFVRIARAAKARGISRGSIKALIEYGRWELGRDFSIASGFAHAFQALYSRVIMAQEPDLIGFFEIRDMPALRGWTPERTQSGAPEDDEPEDGDPVFVLED